MLRSHFCSEWAENFCLGLQLFLSAIVHTIKNRWALLGTRLKVNDEGLQVESSVVWLS